MMIVKKSHGKIFGAHLTNAEKKALDIEIENEFAEYDRKNTDEIDAVILWILHEEFGFEYEQLKRFHDRFVPALEDLCKRYEMGGREDEIWLCTHKLKEDGIDIEEWNRE